MANALREAGITGMRYRDGTAAGRRGESHNYVMLDDEPIEIIRRYAQGGGIMGGEPFPDGDESGYNGAEG